MPMLLLRYATIYADITTLMAFRYAMPTLFRATIYMMLFSLLLFRFSPPRYDAAAIIATATAPAHAFHYFYYVTQEMMLHYY